MQRNRQENAMEEQYGPLAIEPSSPECEGSGLVVLVKSHVCSVSPSFWCLDPAALLISWLISGEWAGEFRIPDKCF